MYIISECQAEGGGVTVKLVFKSIVLHWTKEGRSLVLSHVTTLVKKFLVQPEFACLHPTSKFSAIISCSPSVIDFQ